MAKKSDSEKLEKRTIEAMNGLLWTYKTHYKIAERYEKYGRALNIGTAAGTGILAAAIIWGSVPQKFLLLISLVVALLSWSNATLGFATKSKDHYYAGDQYHALFEDFRDFFDLELTSEDAKYTAVYERYERLAERRKQLNSDAPRTTNKSYGSLDSEDVYGTMETTEDEYERLTSLSN